MSTLTEEAPSTSSRQPTYIRFERVKTILSQEPAFRDRMGDKTEVVLKPDGEEQLFAPEVIQVTQAIHDSGKDAYKVSKKEIMNAAVTVFRIRQQPVPAPAVLPEPAAVPAVKTDKSPEAASAAAETQGQAEKSPVVIEPPVAKPNPVAEPKKKVKLFKQPKNQPGDAVEAEADSEELAGVSEELPKRKVTVSQPASAAYNSHISVYTLLVTALQLTEMFDDKPGKDERVSTLQNLAKDVHQYTTIPTAKSA